MKQVWILERFETREENLKSLQRMNENLEEAKAMGEEKFIVAWEQTIENFKKTIEENPDGYWLGIEGKRNYKDFCYEAKDYMRRHKDDNKKLRVVKAEIEDNAKYWPGYQNPVVNEGVMRYLWATV